MDIAKAVFGGKFMNLNKCIRNQERLKTNELTVQFEKKEKGNQSKTKEIRKEEILRAEIKVKNKKTIIIQDIIIVTTNDTEDQ